MGQVFPILGVPRSGTSLVTRIVHALKVPMGERWKPSPGPDWSPDHLWTDQCFNALHNQLLCDAGSLSYGMDIPKKNQKWWIDYEELIRKREFKNEKWGYKCHYLPLLWPHVKVLFNHEVKPIVLWRNPNESIISYAVRKNLSKEESEKVLYPWWEALVEVSNCFCVRFDDLIDDTKNQIQRIADYLDVEVTEEALNCVQREWRHFRAA